MAISISDTDEVVSDINVTPLVDVMLVLLVVFIVTAPLLTNAVKVTLPSTAKITQVEPQKEAVTLSVDAKGKVYIDKAEVLLTSLEPRLKHLRASQPDVVVHLSADEASNYGVVAKVMSAANRAGVTKLSVLSVAE
jgi:biopolymer transport protein TolR